MPETTEEMWSLDSIKDYKFENVEMLRDLKLIRLLKKINMGTTA